MSIDFVKVNINQIPVKLTEFGFCMSDIKMGVTLNSDTDGHFHGMRRSSTLDIILAFNLSDWTAGYYGEIGGYTAYFSPPKAEIELRDMRTRVVLSADQSTRVTLRTLHKNYLQPPLG